MILSSLAIVALLCFSGCAQKEEMDGHVDALIAALQSGKRSKVDKLLRPNERDDESKDAMFEAMSGAVRQLGPFEDRTMSSLDVRDEKMVGQYSLDFEEGQVGLTINVQDGYITRFEFSGSSFSEAVARAEKSKTKKKKKKKKKD